MPQTGHPQNQNAHFLLLLSIAVLGGILLSGGLLLRRVT
jgi:hypothetical protein